ncbi:phenylalanine--tRNA ligase alpha subunit isoform X1 [Peromyscus californicus insignis]|uniref:phenylalanine--tRNA ligase alpha subunit isoform X1 n=1 Tax=Peromyscus californicus insignis TaxID=564181 RepID=UPI0022A7B8BF|nr:phenylalanine--tRNA ligase alpha subunit isoform X1 [Peromyscus californicus insignis]
MADNPVLELLLRRLEAADGGLDSAELAAQLGVEHQVVVGAVKSLQALGEVIEAELRSTKCWELTAEGEEIAREGSHEARVFRSIPLEGLVQSELMRLPIGKVGFSKAMSNKWIRVDKSAADGPRVFQVVDSIEDEVQRRLQLVQARQAEKLTEKERNELRKRKLLTEVILKTYWVSKGKAFSTSVSKQEAELSPEMISSGSWRDRPFKPYNFSARGMLPDSGHLHPLLKVRSQFRQIFLEMGFTEMPTDNFIESSFWNFDALFQPQQHPARDQHDTFFLKDPAEALQLPMDYVQRVKRTHSQGGYGSQGYKYTWKLEEARKNLLRTHTTSASARILYSLAQKKPFTPAKYFSIDRVFRNETLDATHLAEFHQIEGVIADHGLTLGHLMGVLREFFSKLGITQLRFKPAYNPYTEPSMEVFSYHQGQGWETGYRGMSEGPHIWPGLPFVPTGLKKWVEVGNSGVFRPEMLLPMGLPENVSVIAWGLSLERPTMIKYGINNIRELVGHRVNLQMVYDSPVCRLDIEPRSLQTQAV